MKLIKIIYSTQLPQEIAIYLVLVNNKVCLQGINAYVWDPLGTIDQFNNPLNIYLCTLAAVGYAWILFPL